MIAEIQDKIKEKQAKILELEAEKSSLLVELKVLNQQLVDYSKKVYTISRWVGTGQRSYKQMLSVYLFCSLLTAASLSHPFPIKFICSGATLFRTNRTKMFSLVI